jgi:hypothetical protein
MPMSRSSMNKEIEPWNSPNPKPKKARRTLKGKKGYGSAKASADKKFGAKTSLVKNMYIAKKMKKGK